MKRNIVFFLISFCFLFISYYLTTIFPMLINFNLCLKISLFLFCINLIVNFLDIYKRKKNFQFRNHFVYVLLLLSSLFFLYIVFSLLFPFSSPLNNPERVHYTITHEIGHAIVAEKLFPDSVDSIEILPDWKLFVLNIFNNSTLAYVSRSSPKENNLQTTLDQICVYLAGIVATDLFEFENNYGGASDDLQKAEVAIKNLVKHGIAEIGPYNWNMLTKKQKAKISQKIIDEQYNRAQNIIFENEHIVELLKNKLLSSKKLSKKEITEIFTLMNKN